MFGHDHYLLPVLYLSNFMKHFSKFWEHYLFIKEVLIAKLFGHNSVLKLSCVDRVVKSSSTSVLQAELIFNLFFFFL